MTTQRVRWGLLCTARINDRLIPHIQQSDRSQLLAVASRSVEKAEDYAKKWNIPRAYGEYRELLADADVDLVYISLPNSLHTAWAIESAEAGKHVLCEKPLALTPEDVDRMTEAARRNNVILQEASMYRFHPQTRELQELLAQGAIGDLRLLRANFSFVLVAKPDIRFDPDMGGGSLWDLGVYPVSFALTMAGGNPVEVVGWQVTNDRGVDLSFAGQMRFGTDLLAQFSCSFQAATHWEAQLIGSDGRIHLDLPWLNRVGDTARIEILRGGSTDAETFGDGTDHLQRETRTYEDIDPYRCEVDAMIAAILDGDKPVISLESSRGAIATLAALYTSARENRPIRL